MKDQRIRVTFGGFHSRLFLLLLLVALVFTTAHDTPALAAAGALDSSFDRDGIRVIGSPGDDQCQAVAVQKNDGRIVVAGSTAVSGSSDVLVLRLNANGSFDQAFNNGQRRIINRPGRDRGLAVAVQLDGKIVVVGYTDTFGTEDVLVVRLNRDGSLDSSFSNGGIFAARRAGAERGQAVALQADGKIVVVGYSNTFGTNDALVMRLNSDGSFDSTFANNGVQIVRRSGNDRIQAVTVRTDGRVVVAGTSDVFGTRDVLVMQFTANGALDRSFNNGGIFIAQRTGQESGHSIALQADGRVVIAGVSNVFGTSDFLLIRLTATGSLDQMFAPTNLGRRRQGGVRIVDIGGEEQAQAVAVQPDGKIVVAGYTTLFGLNDFVTMRLNANGSLDTTFDRDGFRVAGLSGENFAQALALQTDRRIVVSGYTDTFDANDCEVMRFLGQ
ncbi:MAG: delta-60 repeat domain-containing protein [Candidatus Binatia bacterium]